MLGYLGSNIGGLSGLADNSKINNVHINNLNINAPRHSGGLLGESNNTVITNSSTQGLMHMYFATKGGGGLIGSASNSQISSSAAHVNQIQSQYTDYGVESIGGLVGELLQSTIQNCYADGNIDNTAVTESIPGMYPKYLGGITGMAFHGSIANAYYAGKILLKNADNVGGAGGVLQYATSTNVFWDAIISGMTKSAFGLGQTTCMMQQKSFWLTQGFDPNIWNLVDGMYPKLVSENT